MQLEIVCSAAARSRIWRALRAALRAAISLLGWAQRALEPRTPFLQWLTHHSDIDSRRNAGLQEQPADCRPALLAAALALPGLTASIAHGELPPEEASITAKYLDYHDWQPGASRMAIRSPAFLLVTPVGENYGLDASYVADSISGASPLYHSTLSGASGKGIRDYRKAGDAKLTRYFSHASVAVRAAVSTENDYFSRAAGVEGTVSTQDNNTTVNFGVGGSADRINSVNSVASGEQRHTLDYLVGITQVLSPTSIVQANVTFSRGHGYFSDPYKAIDTRPDSRAQTALLVRYNRYVDAADAALRVSCLAYRDDWGIRAYTLEGAWEQSLPQGWSVTPGLRYYAQSAAYFYHDPPFPQGFAFGALYTADQRLAAFGAWSPYLQVGKDLGQGWHVDAKADFYRQHAVWRIDGDGSPGLAPFSASSLIVGVKKSF